LGWVVVNRLYPEAVVGQVLAVFSFWVIEIDWVIQYVGVSIPRLRVGRISPDPIAGGTSDPQSLNRYSYVRNMPAMLTDPFGTCPGGVVQNQNSNQSQDAKGSGPSSADSDSGADQDGIQSHFPTGPCPGFASDGGWYGVGNDPFFGPDSGSIYNQHILGGGGGYGDGGLGFMPGPGIGAGMGSNPLGDLLFGSQDPCGTFVNEGEGTVISMGACGGEPGGAGGTVHGAEAFLSAVFKGYSGCAKILGGLPQALRLANNAQLAAIDAPGFAAPTDPKTAGIVNALTPDAFGTILAPAWVNFTGNPNWNRQSFTIYTNSQYSGYNKVCAKFVGGSCVFSFLGR
jgi:hypothetical protein